MEPAVTAGSTKLVPLGRAQSIFGGTTGIQKEIIARGLGL